MADKKYGIKTIIELIIANINECNSEFVTYQTESMKELLRDTLEYIAQKEEECERLRE